MRGTADSVCGALCQSEFRVPSSEFSFRIPNSHFRISPMTWIADRTRYCDSSGIRKVFDLAATMTNPINLSIGQPDFAVPDEIQEAAVDAIHSNRNGYALTQGMPVLRERLSQQIA